MQEIHIILMCNTDHVVINGTYQNQRASESYDVTALALCKYKTYYYNPQLFKA